jgi:hypothetical protein
MGVYMVINCTQSLPSALEFNIVGYPNISQRRNHATSILHIYAPYEYDHRSGEAKHEDAKTSSLQTLHERHEVQWKR